MSEQEIIRPFERPSVRHDKDRPEEGRAMDLALALATVRQGDWRDRSPQNRAADSRACSVDWQHRSDVLHPYERRAVRWLAFGSSLGNDVQPLFAFGSIRAGLAVAVAIGALLVLAWK